MDDRPDLPPLVASALARAARPDYEAWEQAIHAAGLCAQPVRLTGRVYAVDPGSGEVSVAYSSGSQPDRVLLKACGTRRATRCPACAAVYRADAKALLRAGLAATTALGDGTDDLRAAPMVFVTLTAPSFGPVHTSRHGKPCQSRSPGVCPHGRPRGCTEVHDPGEERIGAAACPDCYDFAGAVVFNVGATELWRRTVIAVPRTLAGRLGIGVRTFHRRWRLEYAKVVEFQARGLVHVHALARLDPRPDSKDADDRRETVDGLSLAAAFASAAAKVRAPNPLPGRPALRWGPQVDVAVIASDRRRAAAAYLAKYAIKSVDGAGQLDRRLRAGTLDHLDLPDQLARMAVTAWQLADHPALSDLRLRAWAHQLGYRGHWLTKSRHWSTTFGELRARRQRWRLAQLGITDDQLKRRYAEWEHQGIGHLTPGDAWLVASANRYRQQQRPAAWEDQ